MATKDTEIVKLSSKRVKQYYHRIGTEKSMAEGANYEYLMKVCTCRHSASVSAIRLVFASKSIASSVRPTLLFSSLDISV